MQYKRPRMNFEDLEEEDDIITTSLTDGGDNEEGNVGDFDGGGVDW